MNDAEILGLELVAELIRVTPEEFQRYKLMFLADVWGNPRLTRFLEAVFYVADLRRPKLIEMKEGIA